MQKDNDLSQKERKIPSGFQQLKVIMVMAYIAAVPFCALLSLKMICHSRS